MLRSGARIAATLIVMALMLGLTAGSASAAGQVAGIQTHLLWGDVDDAQMRHQLDLVKASGARMTRVDVGWASLQQDGPNGYSTWYLEKIDRLVAAANQRGISLLMTFMNSPCWASTAPESLKQGCAGSWWDRGVMGYAPSDPQAYARALAFLAARYGDKVAAWEVWNEPNHPDFFKASDQAGAYARLLKAAYPPSRPPTRARPSSAARFAVRLRVHAEAVRARHQGLLRRLLGAPVQRRRVAARRALDDRSPLLVRARRPEDPGGHAAQR